jgi:hypothetical protein
MVDALKILEAGLVSPLALRREPSETKKTRENTRGSLDELVFAGARNHLNLEFDWAAA